MNMKMLPLPAARAVMVGSGGDGKFCNAMFYMNEHSLCKQDMTLTSLKARSKAV